MDPRISDAFNRLSLSFADATGIFGILIDPQCVIPNLGVVALTDTFDDLLDKEDPAAQIALSYKRSLGEIAKALAPAVIEGHD